MFPSNLSPSLTSIIDPDLSNPQGDHELVREMGSSREVWNSPASNRIVLK